MSSADTAEIRFRRLHPDISELAFLAEDCLPARSPLSRCDDCARACPVDVLTAVKGKLELSDGCLRCGRCAAACPTGALRAADFPRTEAMQEMPPARDEPLYVDCWRVPEEVSPEGALRVPCTGGLDAGAVAELTSLRDGPVVVLDRGWCERCPAGGCARPAQTALETAAAALDAAEAMESLLPRFEARGLPRERARGDGPPARSAMTAVSRRGLFRRMAGEVAGALDDTPMEAEGEGPSRPLRDRIPAPPRQRMVRALERFDETLPASQRPGLNVDQDACCNQRVCASLCPTGALEAFDAEGGSGLHFRPEECIGCELCVRVCPERALTSYPEGGQSGELTRHAFRRCPECRRPFAGGEGRFCPSCDKKYGLLAGGGYELLFGQAPDSRAPDGCGARVQQASRDAAGADAKTRGSESPI